ncbi:hypothetical protein J6590_055859 [Homalodisca vitripennis]|nr:hypothetical protein J6590_055859 [Homalodisca vitripennis]
MAFDNPFLYWYKLMLILKFEERIFEEVLKINPVTVEMEVSPMTHIQISLTPTPTNKCKAIFRVKIKEGTRPADSTHFQDRQLTEQDNCEYNAPEDDGATYQSAKHRRRRQHGNSNNRIIAGCSWPDTVHNYPVALPASVPSRCLD